MLYEIENVLFNTFVKNNIYIELAYCGFAPVLASSNSKKVYLGNSNVV
jgi:hypothetical protein